MTDEVVLFVDGSSALLAFERSPIDIGPAAMRFKFVAKSMGNVRIRNVALEARHLARNSEIQSRKLHFQQGQRPIVRRLGVDDLKRHLRTQVGQREPHIGLDIVRTRREDVIERSFSEARLDVIFRIHQNEFAVEHGAVSFHGRRYARRHQISAHAHHGTFVSASAATPGSS